MGFSAPLGLLGLALLAPIIAMYLLKRRREEVAVSSVYLWERVVQDIEANAPWQKLRRNLLLLLQLLFLLLAVFGLARPFVTAAGAAGQSLILVLDSSISMGASDGEQGSRLDTARSEALRLMEGLPDNGRVTLLRAGDGADILVANTDDRLAVQQALDSLQPLARDSDLGPALTLAAAAAARQADSEIVVISDGAVQMPGALAVDRPIRYVPVGSDSNNQAISALNMTRLPDGSYELFVQVTNHGPSDVARRLLVEIDGRPFTASDLSIPAGQQTSKLFSVADLGDFEVQARLEGEDGLSGDDSAWTVPGPSGQRRVRLITPSEQNRFLSVPFRILPEVELTQANVLSDTAISEDNPADLLILDRWLPDEGLPGTTENLLVVSPPPGNDIIQTSGVFTAPFPVVAGNVPSLEENLFFEDDLFMVEARRGEVPDWGTVVLEDSTTGAPLLWVGEQEGRRVAVVNFAIYGSPESVPMDPQRDLVLTNLVYHPAYPVLMASLADYLLAGPAGGLAGETLLPGQLVTLPLLDSEGIEIQTPSGTRVQPVTASDAATVRYETAEPGVYTARWLGGEQEPIRFTVNLFTNESRITPSPTLALTSVDEAPGAESGLTGEARREIWRPLLLVGLILLAFEWMVYQKDAVRRLRALSGRIMSGATRG